MRDVGNNECDWGIRQRKDGGVLEWFRITDQFRAGPGVGARSGAVGSIIRFPRRAAAVLYLRRQGKAPGVGGFMILPITTEDQ